MERLRSRPIKERREFRQFLAPEERVRILLPIDEYGNEIDLTVDELDAGGARVKAERLFDYFDDGQILGPITLVLENTNEDSKQVKRLDVTGFVRWKRWPHIGIEFRRASTKDREAIFRFLFRVQRRILRKTRLHWTHS